VTPLWWTRVIWLGDRGSDVRAVQQLVGLPQSGVYDYDTASVVRGFQIMMGLEGHGHVDEPTALNMGPRSQDDLPPEWYDDKPLYPETPAYGLVSTRFGGESGIRRLQGQHGMTPTGVIDLQTALILGALGA
jgi:peptidoglycan hydrolase-like protein with peptidoglycan-binding domain